MNSRVRKLCFGIWLLKLILWATLQFHMCSAIFSDQIHRDSMDHSISISIWIKINNIRFNAIKDEKCEGGCKRLEKALDIKQLLKIYEVHFLNSNQSLRCTNNLCIDLEFQISLQIRSIHTSIKNFFDKFTKYLNPITLHICIFLI